MQKIPVLLAIMTILSVSVHAAENNLEINFVEFCPIKKLQNIDTSKHYKISSKQYWAQRKLKFEERKAYCLGLDTDEKKGICVDKLRIFETNLTKKYFEQQNQVKK